MWKQKDEEGKARYSLSEMKFADCKMPPSMAMVVEQRAF